MTGDPPPRPAERFKEVFDVYFAEIHRYAAKRLGPDAAADVAAQTFLEAFRQRRRYAPKRAQHPVHRPGHVRPDGGSGRGRPARWGGRGG
jgi:hypothetical protein